MTVGWFLKDLVNFTKNKPFCVFRETPVGPIHDGDEFVSGSFARETENHLLCIESSRFLDHEALGVPSDNTASISVNGATWSALSWLQNRLNVIFQEYFYEFNSAAYERYHAFSVINLFDNANDLSLRNGARMILDLLSAHESVSTKDGRRMAPFRRHASDWDPSAFLTRHQERDRFQILTGANRMLADLCPQDSETEVNTAIGRYPIPDLILDRLLNRAHHRGVQRLHMGNLHSTLMDLSLNSNNSTWAKP